MIGRIRSKHYHCGKCNSIYRGEPLVCPTCGIKPDRYVIDLSWRGKRIRLYSNRHGEPLSSYEMAEAELIFVRADVKAGKFNPAQYVQRDQAEFLFENFLKARMKALEARVRRGEASPNYLTNARRIARRFLHFFNGCDVREITAQKIQEFNDWIPSGGMKYRINTLGLMHKHLADALELGLIQNLPRFPRFDRRKAFRHRWIWIEEEDQDRIIRDTHPDNHDILNFMVEYGTRIGEACSLWWEDVDFDHGTITIRSTTLRGVNDIDLTCVEGVVRVQSHGWYRVPWPKDVDPRVLPMTDKMRSMLERLHRVRPPIHGRTWVFLNEHGNPFLPSNLARIWRRASRRMNINIPLKDGARHSRACQARRDGVDLDTIGRLLGHSDPNTTRMFYAQDEPRNLLRAVRNGLRSVSGPVSEPHKLLKLQP